MLILKKIYITNVNIFVIQYKYINILFLVSIFSLVSVCRNFRPGRLFPFAGGSTAEPAIAGGRASGPAIPSIDEAASAARHEAVYDESRPFTEQLEPVLLAHVTVSYRLNRKRVAHEFALKMLNLTPATRISTDTATTTSRAEWRPSGRRTSSRISATGSSSDPHGAPTPYRFPQSSAIFRNLPGPRATSSQKNVRPRRQNG